MRFSYQLTDSTKHFTIFCVAIVERDGKLLMIQDGGKDAHGRWALPGKASLTNEKLTQVTEKGVRELTSMRTKVDSMVGVYHTYHEENHEGILLVGFVMKPSEDAVSLSNDALGYHWYSYRDVFEMPEESFANPAIRQLIKDYRQGKRYSTDIIKSI